MLDTQPTPAPPAPGTLTEILRAAEQTSEKKALRIGLVLRGKVIEERILAPGQGLTIGPNERADLVVVEALIPPGFHLIESKAEGFSLRVAPGMSGRVAGRNGTLDIDSEKENTVRSNPAEIREIALDPDARGKVFIGQHLILFQLVKVAPPLGKPQLPATLKSGLGDVDWRTSIVAAFSFLFHFGALGTIYTDWMDPVVDDEVQAAQLIESMRELPPPPPIEKPKEDAASASASPSASPAPKSASPSAGRTAATGGGGGSGAARGDARASQISNQLAALEVQMVAALGTGSGQATASVLGPGGDLPLGMLDKAAQSASGTRAGTAGLDLGGGFGAPLRPGAIARPGLPGGDTSMGPVNAGAQVNVRGPTGTVGVPPPTVIGDEIPNAPRVVAAMTAGFRRCYNIGLRDEDPAMKGTVRVTAKVGPNGEVLGVSASKSGTVTATVSACIQNRVRSAQFESPTGAGGTVVIPVTLIPQ